MGCVVFFLFVFGSDVYFVGLRAGPLEIADGLAKPAADFGEFLGTENKHYYNENSEQFLHADTVHKGLRFYRTEIYRWIPGRSSKGRCILLSIRVHNKMPWRDGGLDEAGRAEIRTSADHWNQW